MKHHGGRIALTLLLTTVGLGGCTLFEPSGGQAGIPHERITLGATLPWVSAWLNEAGKPQQSLNGLGDLELAARVLLFRERRFAPHHLLWGLVGLKFPTGYRLYDDTGHPFPADDQPGTGSWDPFVGGTYAWFGNGMAVFASASYKVTTPNERAYRRGSALGIMFGVASMLTVRSRSRIQVTTRSRPRRSSSVSARRQQPPSPVLPTSARAMTSCRGLPMSPAKTRWGRPARFRAVSCKACSL